MSTVLFLIDKITDDFLLFVSLHFSTFYNVYCFVIKKNVCFQNASFLLPLPQLRSVPQYYEESSMKAGTISVFAHIALAVPHLYNW